MNLDFKYRGQIEGLPGGSWIAQSIQALIHAVGAGWDAQHNGDGSHGVATFGSASGPSQRAGSGSPEGAVVAPVGSIYMRTDGDVNAALYVKRSGSGSTGWSAVGANPATLQYASVTLSDTHIKALPTTHVTIAPAPGVGYRLKPIGATMTLDTSAGAYTGIDATYASLELDCGFKWPGLALINDNSLATPLTSVSDFLGIAHSRVLDVQFPWINALDSDAVSGSFGYVTHIRNSQMPARSDIENEALKLNAENGGASFTGGNAANTLKVTVYYIVEAL